MEDARKAARTITDLLEFVETQEGPSLPTAISALQEKSLRSLAEALNVTSRYESEDSINQLDRRQINIDMCILAAININNSQTAGALVGRVRGLEKALKLAKSRVHILCKSEKEKAVVEGGRVSITDKDIEHVTRIKTAHITEVLEQEEVLAEFSNHVYFSIMKFIETVQNAMGRRMDSEKRYGDTN